MILGLDLSSTSTGVCFDGETSTIAPKGTLLERARAMRDEIRHLLIPAPDLVVIEGIGTRHVQTAISIATVHALVLDEVVGYAPLLTVQPKTLKKWATGKGAGPETGKVQMSLVAQRLGWHTQADSGDDEADAWLLWTIGEALRGRRRVPETQYRQDVIEALNWPEMAA